MASDSSTDPLRVVIPIVAGIGNALLAVPMVRELKRLFPGAKILVLARTEAMGEPLRRLTEVAEVRITGKGIEGIKRNVLWSRKFKPDIYLVPFPSNRWQYAMLALLSGGKMKVLHSYPVGYLRAMHFVGTRVAPQRGIHDVQQNLNLLTALSRTPREASPPGFAVMLSERAAAVAQLMALGFGDEAEPIIIHAGSAQTVLGQAKRWPPASYGQLIAALHAEFGDRVLLVEGPDERGVADEILQSPAIVSGGILPKVVRLSGPLGEAAAILERAQLYVGSDSGLGHLAAAVGTTAVTLFAPAEPDRVSPFGYRDLVVQAQTPCSPCAQYPWLSPHPKILCREPMCITTITVEAVMEKVRRAMVAATAAERMQ